MSAQSDYLTSEKVVRVNITSTLTGANPTTAVWVPGAGKRVVLKGFSLRARVTTVLAGANPGDQIAICENAISTPLWTIGVIKTATDAAGTDYGPVSEDIPGGFWPAAGSNIRICCGPIGTGVISVQGFLWGDEPYIPPA